MFRSKKPTEISKILASTIKYRRLENKFKQYEGFSYWKEIVGSKLAEVSKPDRISQSGILTIKVADSTWGQELSLQKQKLISLYNDHPKTLTINDIKFAAGNPKDFSN